MCAQARIMTSDGSGAGPEVAAAADALNRGRLVAFPTETVYGLAARADMPEALDLLAAAKDRPSDRPFAVLIGDASDVALHVDHVPEDAAMLMARFWPGPMTLVLTARDGGTVGLRLPDHALARAVCRAVPGGVVATSVNRSGEPPLLDAASVAARFGDRVELIIDESSTASGRASTVLRLDDRGWWMLREGEISTEAVTKLIGPPTQSRTPDEETP